MRTYTFIDLFAGVGGLSRGFIGAGFELLGAFEKDDGRAAWFNQYVAAGKATCFDLTRAGADAIRAEIDGHKIDVVVGAPPTKPIASSGHKQGSLDEQYLVPEFLQLAIDLQPRVIVLDTVKGFLGSRFQPEREAAFAQLAAAGYTNIQHQKLNAVDFGVPQSREHAYVVAIKESLFTWAWPTGGAQRASMADVLDDLLPTLPDHPLPHWLEELDYPATGALLVSGKNKNKWTPQWFPFSGPAFTMTESMGNRHRIRDYSDRWCGLTTECIRRLQGLPVGYGEATWDALAVATPPPLAQAVAEMVRDGLGWL